MSNALSGQVFAAMFCLALSTFLSVYPALLIFPLILLVADVRKKTTLSAALICVVTFLLSLVTMAYSSFLWLGSWNYISSTYSVVLLMTDLTPNVGLWWYFFTEMFEDFRQFFLGVFQLHLFIYVVPLCIKLRCVRPCPCVDT